MLACLAVVRVPPPSRLDSRVVGLLVLTYLFTYLVQCVGPSLRKKLTQLGSP